MCTFVVDSMKLNRILIAQIVAALSLGFVLVWFVTRLGPFLLLALVAGLVVALLARGAKEG